MIFYSCMNLALVSFNMFSCQLIAHQRIQSFSIAAKKIQKVSQWAVMIPKKWVDTFFYWNPIVKIE